MDFLVELASPGRVAAAVTAVLGGLFSLVYFGAKRWVASVEDGLRGRATVADLARLEKHLDTVDERFLAAAQRAAGAFREIAELDRHRAETTEELRRIRAEVDALQREVWTGRRGR